MKRSSRNRIAVTLCAWAVLCSLSGCSFLANEFGWYDRAPVAERAVDVGVAGTVDRP